LTHIRQNSVFVVSSIQMLYRTYRIPSIRVETAFLEKRIYASSVISLPKKTCRWQALIMYISTATRDQVLQFIKFTYDPALCCNMQ